jgi:DHA2 family multidrug resistance protein-like MFS transporter
VQRNNASGAAPPVTLPDGLPPPARHWAMAVIILGIALSVLDGSIVNLALPGIARDLQAPPSDSILVVNAYQIATLALLLPCAALGDRFSYRRVYLIGLAVFTAASAVCLMSTSLTVLVAARAMQGLGAAGIMGVNPALVRLTYPSHMLGRGIALNSVVVATASVAGPTIAAAILSVASWPWLFALNIPLGLLLLALGWRALPPNPPRSAARPRLRAADVVLNMLFFGFMFMGMNILAGSAGSFAPHAPAGAGLIAVTVGIALGYVYFRRQRHQAAPLLPVDLLRIPIFALSMLTSVSAFAAQTLAFLALPFLMLDAWHLSAMHAGLLITAWPCGVVLSAPVAGALIGRYHGGLLGGVGLGLLCAGLVLLAFMPDQPSTVQVAWRLLVCGVGFGLFQSPNNHTIVTSAPLHRAGAASGMLGTARITGQAGGAVLVALVFALAGTAGGAGPRAALGLAALFAAASGLFSMARTRSGPQASA